MQDDGRNPSRLAQNTGAAVGVAGMVAGGVVGGMVLGPAGVLLGAGSAAWAIIESRKRRNLTPQNDPQVWPREALAVTFQMPQDAVQWQDGAVVFGIDVAADGNTWRVMKRYSDFYNLNATLAQEAEAPYEQARDITSVATHLFPRRDFPRKHFTGCSGRKLESRRRKLESWLRRVVCQGPASWDRHLRHFLEYPLHQRPSGIIPQATAAPTHPAAESAPAAPPLVTAIPCTLEMRSFTSSPLAVASPVLQTMSHASGETMEVIIPLDVYPGQVIAVQMPDGPQIGLTVPDGALPGSVVRFMFEWE